MITAKEARYRVENSKMIKEIENRIETSVMAAIEHEEFKTIVIADRKIGEDGLDIIINNLIKLGYYYSVIADSMEYDITIEW